MNKWGLLTGLLLACHLSPGQMQEYSWKRPVTGVSALWHRIELPEELFIRSQSELKDLRLYGITAEGDTVQAPYVLQSSERRRTSHERAFDILNVSYNDEGTWFTLSMSDTLVINEIRMDFRQENYDWQLDVEGSMDGEEWFVLKENQRIVAVRNQYVTFNYSRVNLPRSAYRYYRIRVRDQKDAELLRASVNYNAIRDGKLEPRLISDQRLHFTNLKTMLDLVLVHSVPVSRLELDISDTLDYFRPLILEAAIDSLRTEEGYLYRYREVARGKVHSREQVPLEFNPVTAHRYRISIQDMDNAHLSVKGAQLSGPSYWLLARFEKEATYFLVYGRKGDRGPQFDIQNFSLPGQAQPVTVGDEEPINEPIIKPEPLFVHKAWLWLVMGLVIILLGWYTLRMMKSE